MQKVDEQIVNFTDYFCYFYQLECTQILQIMCMLGASPHGRTQVLKDEIENFKFLTLYFFYVHVTVRGFHVDIDFNFL